MTVCKTAPVL